MDAKVMDPSAYPSRPMGPTSKSLRDDQNERLRGILRDLVDAKFGGSASAAARELGIAQSLVSEFLTGGRGAGPKLLNAVAEHTGRSLDDLYGRRFVESSGDLPRRIDPPQTSAPLLKNRPEFPQSLRLARELRPQHGGYVWNALGESAPLVTVPITPALLADLADVLAKYLVPPQNWKPSKG